MTLTAITTISAMIPGMSGAQRLTGPKPAGDVPAPVVLDGHGDIPG